MSSPVPSADEESVLFPIVVAVDFVGSLDFIGGLDFGVDFVGRVGFVDAAPFVSSSGQMKKEQKTDTEMNLSLARARPL